MDAPPLTVNRRLRRRGRLAGWVLTVAPAAVLAVVAPAPWRWWAVGATIVAIVAWHRFMNEPGAVPILVYHSVSDRPGWLPWADGISLSSDDFRRHLDILRRIGARVIATSELIAARRAGRELPDRAVVLHFDDGYLDNRVAAEPLLARYGMLATIFVSVDFVEEGEALRPTLDDVEAGRAEAPDLTWEGYMNWAELAAAEATGRIEIEPHGTDHARVAVGPRVVDRLTEGNWRRHAWMQWERSAGRLSDWWRAESPPHVPLGAPVPESRPALEARAWVDGERESEAAYEERVRRTLERARRTLEERLGGEARVFCWPYSGTAPTARRIAAEVGFAATTGGTGENRPGEDPRVLSRVHAGDRALGFRWPWLDDLAFRGTVRLNQGCYYALLWLTPIYLSRTILLRLRRRMGWE